MEGAREKNRDEAPLVIGRYALFDIIAAGGMATVHIGRLLGPVGFCRTVAVKRLHPMFARDPEFVSMFLDEARLAARVRHPHVIQTVDVVATKGELFVVMDYVEGESLARLMRALRNSEGLMPLRVVSAIVSGALQGLHAAHEAKDERGADLGIVHRDVSPQNVLVGVDGLARVLDFGIAKATGRMQTTREGQVKGKLAYMAPEQVHGETMTRTADIYAAAIVAWETITAQRLFRADNESAVLAKVLAGDVAPPSTLVPEVPKELDAVIMRGLARDPALRFATAKEMAQALEKCVPPASSAEVAEWLAPILGPLVADRASLVAQIETDSGLSSLESLKESMLKELSVPPVVRTTTRLESAAQQAIARVAAANGGPASLPPASMPPVSASAATAPSSVVLAPPSVVLAPPNIVPLPPISHASAARSGPYPSADVTQSIRRPRNSAFVGLILGAGVVVLLFGCAVAVVMARRTPDASAAVAPPIAETPTVTPTPTALAATATMAAIAPAVSLAAPSASVAMTASSTPAQKDPSAPAQRRGTGSKAGSKDPGSKDPFQGIGGRR